MKQFLLLLALTLCLQSCWPDQESTNPESVAPIETFEAITLDRPTFEDSISLEDPRSITDSGKIYVFNELLFVNEMNEGFHIFDNVDPTNPTPLAFIVAPGATDLAIKNEVYYINQAVDLIAVTYDKEAANLQVTKRIRDVFPPKLSPEGFTPFVEDGRIIIDYQPIN